MIVPDDIQELYDTKASVLERRCADAALACAVQYRIIAVDTILSLNSNYWLERASQMEADYADHIARAIDLEGRGL